MGRQQGHRQRGAGAVTVSRGEQVRQGVLCKEWQRTPVQLLHEYCQSKKRKNPIYSHVKSKQQGKHRMRCVLPDDKSSTKDLAFCPEQEFETIDEAKHCVALLALQYLEPTRPLERKLPDPYRELWLSMTSAASSSATDASSKPKKPKKPTTEATKPAENDMKEPKQPKDPNAMNLWGDEETETDDASANTKQFPTALTSDRKFVSKAEQMQAQLERKQERNRKQRMRENRERANQHKQVFMSAACREQIEAVLRRLGTIQSTDLTNQSTNKEHLKEWSARITKELAAIGFQDAHIQGAMQCCERDPEHSDEEFLTMILNWLCLNVTESDLPAKFNPTGTQLDVVVNSPPVDQHTAAYVQRLMKFGYDRLDASVVVQQYLTDNNEEKDLDEVIMELLQQLHPSLLKHLETETIGSADVDPELGLLRQEEIFALEAIYEDRIKITEQPPVDAGIPSYQLKIQVSEDVELHVFLPSTSKYPFELPLIGVASANSDHQSHLLPATGDALKNCANMLGEPMLYDICVAVDSFLSRVSSKTKQKTSKMILLDHTPAMRTPAPVVPPPAPVVPNEKPKKQQPIKKNKHSKRPEDANLRLLSEKLLQLRRSKDKNPTFQQMLAQRSKLPAAAAKDDVLQAVQHHQVVLICGQTGCGKTTQIPQFLLDRYIDAGNGGACSIICTQPRRIAAIGVATRVAQERAEAIADVVGYQIRMDARKSAQTRLLFCTTGVLLRRLLSDRSLQGISHIIVDEVHERNIDTDFLLSVLRDLLPKRPDLRLILMSATMNASLFVNYFSNGGKTKCPVLEIPGFTYPVNCHFLDDVLSMTEYQVPKHLLKKKAKTNNDDNAQKEKPLAEWTPQELVERMDDSKIDYDLYVHLVQHVITSTDKSGAILIFLPGTAEIKRMIEGLQQSKELGHRIWAVPLHGSLSAADQALVFKSPPSGKTKVIVSTNIAETSITINDITAVIDCGKVNEMVYDPLQKRSQLLDVWASQAACDQRKGRAGRVQAGTCYRLFSKRRFDSMASQLAAEIHRVSLEQLCLQIKKLELGSIQSFLFKAIEPPKQEAVDAAIRDLIEIAAFAKQNEQDPEDVALTPLGSHLAMLPLDARIGKFLIYGSILRCVEPVAIMAASMSSKNPFLVSLSDQDLRSKQEAIKKEIGGNWKSDHLLIWKLVERYQSDKSTKAKRSFCRDHGLSYETMETIVDLKQQYLQQLDTIGFYDASQSGILNANASVPRIIKAALCAGLYANVVQVVYPEQKYFQSAHGVFTEDHEAKKLRYFIQSPSDPKQRERVFLHPSSCNFVQSQYDSPWLLYTELVQTSKVFVRDSTMVNPYALLLFGGALDVVHDRNLLVIDQWIQFHAVARIGVLIKSIRKHLDQLLLDKIANPAVDIANSELVTAISHLLKSEGM